MTMNFEPHGCAIFTQSGKIGTPENKAIHSTIESSSRKDCDKIILFANYSDDSLIRAQIIRKSR